MNFSKTGFILATLGSSIGLGHIWKFPYTAGINGGGAFVLLYVVLACSIGVAMLIAEMLIGLTSRKNALECYPTLASQHAQASPKYQLFGVGVFVGPIVLSFYAIVLGWIVCYLGLAFVGYPQDVYVAKILFTNLSTLSFWIQSLSFSLILFLSAFIVAKGIKRGIETCNMVFMPLLFAIFCILLVYSYSMQEGFSKSIAFLFRFEIDKITPLVFMQALGQVFFSLSLGVGTILTYARYSQNSQNLLKSSLWVVLSGIIISLIAGVMIFAFLYEFGQNPTQGASLMLQALPLAFGKMNEQIAYSGQIVGFFFFLAVIFAGITSAVSLLEPIVVVLQEKYHFTQAKAVWIATLCIWLIGEIIIISSLESLAPSFSLFERSLFDNLTFLSSDLLMPIGGLLVVVFVGYKLNRGFLESATSSFFSRFQFRIWLFLVRFVIPVVIMGIIIFGVLSVF